MNKRWPFTFNFLQFAALAAVAPFLVLYYQGLGFSGVQIGALTGITPLVTFFTAPLWAGFADASHRHGRIMNRAILGGVLSLILFPYLTAFLPVLLIAVLLYFFLAPLIPFADSATMFMLADEKEMYGRVRLGGTIGFGVIALVAGILVQNNGLKYAFWLSAVLLLLGFFISRKLVFSQSLGDRITWSRVRVMIANPRWAMFLLLAFFGGLALAAFNNYLFPYMKELGAGEAMMGLAILVGTISEIPVLFYGNRLIRRFKPFGLLLLSMVVTSLRLLLFAMAGTTALVILVQLLNGLTFPAMWVAGVAYADENASPGMSTTAQGLFSAMVFGIGTAVGGFLGGLLLETLGGRDLFLVFGAAVMITVVLVAALRRRIPDNKEPSFNGLMK